MQAGQVVCSLVRSGFQAVEGSMQWIRYCTVRKKVKMRIGRGERKKRNEQFKITHWLLMYIKPRASVAPGAVMSLFRELTS